MQVADVTDEGDTTKLKGLSEVLNKSLFGGRAKDVMVDEAIEARNVLTIIDRLSRKMDVPLDGSMLGDRSTRIRITTE